MTIKQAFALVSIKYPKLVAIRCVEFDSCFVFQMVPPKYKNTPDIVYDCLNSVDKKTGEVRTFQPFHIPVEEYRNGKEIKNFK